MTKRTSIKTILFVTPFFGKTGSEVMLLNLLKSLNRELIEPHLFSMQDGELLHELPADIKYYLPYNTRKNKREKFLNSILKRRKILPLEYQLKKIQKSIRAEIWYINTIVIDPIFLRLAKLMKVKIITHFHELPNAYRFISEDHLKLIIGASDICIGCSSVVCEKIEELGHKNVQLLHSFIDTKLIEKQKRLTSNDVKKELKVSPNDFVWLISGSVTYDKGVDYLPEILNCLENEKLIIIWLGKCHKDGLLYYVQTILENKWPEKVLFLDALKDNYYDYLASADGLLMLSRQDSFPLVMLEANYLGIPIVSFNSGGVNELINESNGIVVNSWNAIDLASAMKQMMKEKIKPAIKSKDFKYSIEKQIDHFHNIILNN